MMRTSKLTSADVDSYRKLRLLSLQTDPNAFYLQYEKAVNHSEAYFLAELTGNMDQVFGFYGTFEVDQLVGMISLQPLSTNAAQIFTLYVNPEFRGKGIGKNLLTHVITQAESNSIAKLRLTVIAGNRAIPLYESLGFWQIGRNIGALKNQHGVFDELVYQMEI